MCYLNHRQLLCPFLYRVLDLSMTKPQIGIKIKITIVCLLAMATAIPWV